jgi:hypothetical protein
LLSKKSVLFIPLPFMEPPEGQTMQRPVADEDEQKEVGKALIMQTIAWRI